MTQPTGIFCAIDKNNLADAKEMVTRLAGLPVHIKLGLEFFVSEGPQGVTAIRDMLPADTKIFLDLKLHDIPNTVAGAVRAVTKLGVDYLTLHTSGGTAMMRAAVDAAQTAAVDTGKPAPCLLGVTVLTNLDAQDLQSVGVVDAPAAQVLRLATLAVDCGFGGAICAPQEISLLRDSLPASFQLVVPGIRPAGSAVGDQKRTMTPPEAARAGADYLVIGRPITEASDPAQATSGILASMTAKAA